jgi:hypothetical protein
MAGNSEVRYIFLRLRVSALKSLKATRDWYDALGSALSGAQRS